MEVSSLDKTVVVHELELGYHFAGFASCFAAQSCLPKWFIITHVWFELGTYKKIPQTLGSSVDHIFCQEPHLCFIAVTLK